MNPYAGHQYFQIWLLVTCPGLHSSGICVLLFQERLLLSLLPAHIAMEMKAEIIQRLQGPKAGQMENTNNFHNLYVKRHTNVRYACSGPGGGACGILWFL